MKAILVTMLGVGIGCGTSGSEPAPTDDLDSVELSPAPGWPSSVEVRSVPRSFRTSVTTMEVDSNGRVWLLRDQWSDASQALGTPVP